MKFNPPFFKTKTQKTEYFLGLDIGSETVKGLFFKKQNEKVIILDKVIEYFDQFGIFEIKDFGEKILKEKISNSIKKFREKAKNKIEKIFLSLPANILKGEIILEKFERKNPSQSINASEKEQILKDVFKKIKVKISQKFSQRLALLPEDFLFLNFEILETKIDGYEILEIKGFSGKFLDFKVFATFLSKYDFGWIQKVFGDLNLKIFKINHPAENLLKIFKIREAIFLDIGGKFTKIFLIEKGKLEKIFEFEMGGFNFTKRLSDVLGTAFSEARMLKHNFAQSVLSEDVKLKIKEIFSNDFQDWSVKFKDNLKKISKKILPQNIFLFGGGAQLPGFLEIFEKGNFNDLPFIFKPKIKYILPKDLKDIEDENQILNSPQDISLLLITYE